MKGKETILTLPQGLDVVTRSSLSLELIIFSLHERLKFVAAQNRCGFGGIRFPHVKGFDSLSFKDYLISQTILWIIRCGPKGPRVFRSAIMEVSN
jgi:hypothetical protein